MPLPSFPPKVWSTIFDYACQDNGNTGLALSRASRNLRVLSMSHRYQSIQVTGWKQLLAFEEQFSNAPQEQQRILNLFVDLPSVFDALYPEHPMWAPKDYEPDDGSYVPSETSDVSPLDEWDTEDELEYEPLSESDLKGMQEERDPIVYSSLHPGNDPTSIEEDPRPTFQAEGRLYATLRRLLEACAPYLEIFTLCWKPWAASEFGVVLILPDSLPKLKSLAVWKDDPELYDPRFNDWEDRIAIEAKTRVFSLLRLERLEIDVPIIGRWPQHLPLDSLRLKYATTPCTFVNRLYNMGTERIRIFCDCENCSDIEQEASRVSFRIAKIDFKNNWEEQIVRHSFDTGFDQSNIKPDSTPPLRKSKSLAVKKDKAQPALIENPSPDAFGVLVKGLLADKATKPVATVTQQVAKYQASPPNEFDLLVKEIMVHAFRRLDCGGADETGSASAASVGEEEGKFEPMSEDRRSEDGEEEGKSPVAVLVVVWSEDGTESGYIDTVLLTDDEHFIQLGQHAQQLHLHGVEGGTHLELYDVAQKVWAAVTETQSLGPFHSGGVVLLRRRGVKIMESFNAFLPLARSTQD